MDLQCCTKLNSTVVTLLIMLLYWWLFSDLLNPFALVLAAENGQTIQSSCASSLGDCSSDDQTTAHWHNKYTETRQMESSDDYFAAVDGSVKGKRWSFTNTFFFLMVVVSMVVGLLSAAALGSLLALAVFLKSGKKWQLQISMPSRLQALYTLKKHVNLVSPLGGGERYQAVVVPSTAADGSGAVLVGTSVDTALAKLLDTVLECEVLPWYTELVIDTKPAINEIRQCAWYVMEQLAALARSVDGVGFLTAGVATCLTRHLQRIRQVQLQGEKAGERGVFHLVPQLSSPDRERNFLRRLSEYLLMHTLPHCYYNCLPLRTLCREMLACKVLEVFVDRLCSPDWINQQIVEQLARPPQKPLTKTASSSDVAGATTGGGGKSSTGVSSYQRYIELLVQDPRTTDWGIEQLVCVIQDCTDEERLEFARQALQEELLVCAATAAGGLLELASTESATPAASSWRTMSVPSKLHKDKFLDQAEAVGGRCVSDMTRARAECERRLLAVKAGLTDLCSDTDKLCPAASFSSVLESGFCRRHLHYYLHSLQSLTTGITTNYIDDHQSSETKAPLTCNSKPSETNRTEQNVLAIDTVDNDMERITEAESHTSSADVPGDEATSVVSRVVPDNGSNVKSVSGVAALGLYCSLQELMVAPYRFHEAIRRQIYYTYFSSNCSRPVPIDEVVQQHIWQLVLAGSSKGGGGGGSSTCAPLIGCLAGAVEEVGQFLQTRYSTGFLHSSHYRTMLSEATTMGHQIATGVDCGIDIITKSSLIGLGPPCTLQQQLHHTQLILALHQEKNMYKTWAMNSLATVDSILSEDCAKEAEEASRYVKSYETHLHSLQLWIENLGKWRVHVQGVEFGEEKDNPEIILLVSLDEESPNPGCLPVPTQSTNPSSVPPRSPIPPPRSPVNTFKSAVPPKSPQPSVPRTAAATVPVPRSPQHRSSTSQGQIISSIANSVINSTLSAISTAATADTVPPLLHKHSPVNTSTDVNHSGVQASDSLKGGKSKSLSFEKENGSMSTTFQKSSSSLDKLTNLSERPKYCSEKSYVSLGKSKGSLEKSSDSLKSKSSTGSLERLFSNLSKSSSGGSYSETEACEGGDRGAAVLPQQYISGQENMDGWVIVRKLSHFTELHKKLCSHWPKLKSRDAPCLPSKSIFSSKSVDSERACTEKLRAAAQRYLSTLTWDAMDPGPARSVLFYEFVCPTQHLLWRPQPLPAKKSKFSLSSLFKGREGKGDSDEEENALNEPISRRLASLSETAPGTLAQQSSASASGSSNCPALATAAVAANTKPHDLSSIAVQLFGDKRMHKSSDGGVDTTDEAPDIVAAETNLLELASVGGSVTAPDKVSTAAVGVRGSTGSASSSSTERTAAAAAEKQGKTTSTAAAAAAAHAGALDKNYRAVSAANEALAEPLFALLEELCELRGRGKWLRKTLVSFVQITYGKNITRHVRETASGLLSEEMLACYITALEQGLWPEPRGGSISDLPLNNSDSSATQYQRTQKQLNEIREEARSCILRVLPELLAKLVGGQNAIKGAHRLFATLQHHALNKNLFYNILEELLQEMFPDLREHLEQGN